MKPDLKKPTAQDLLGVWNLVRWEITYDDGRPTTYPFGPDATGLIQYTHDGGMAACMADALRWTIAKAAVRSPRWSCRWRMATAPEIGRFTPTSPSQHRLRTDSPDPDRQTTQGSGTCGSGSSWRLFSQ